jgi:hypothetical protein
MTKPLIGEGDHPIIARLFWKVTRIDGLVKSRHSRENGNPENSNYMKILDSCLRRNDRKSPFRTFYKTIRNLTEDRFVKR